MQWQAWIRSCSVNGSLSACWFAFDWYDDGFSCSNTVAKWNLSLFLSHEYHHPDSLQLTNGKDGSKQHFLESIEEAYYLVEVMLFVSFLPCIGARRACSHARTLCALCVHARLGFRNFIPCVDWSWLAAHNSALEWWSWSFTECEALSKFTKAT
jgi:hypothetical protein